MKNLILTFAVGAVAIFPLVAGAKAKDTKPPVIANHADVVVVVNGVTSATVTYTPPTATDNVDTSVAVSCTPASGTVFQLGTTIVTCNAHDVAGNVDQATFKVIVKDTTPPAITVTHIAGSANATQAVAGDTVTLSFGTSENIFTPIILVSSHSLFMHSIGSEATWQASYVTQTKDPLGKVVYLVTAIDKAGNISICSNVHLPIVGYCPPTDGSSVTIVKTTPPDTTPPTIAPHGDVTSEATSPAGAVVTYISPTATDNSTSTIAVDCAPASGSTFPVGNTTVTCTAQDTAGNTATPTTFLVKVLDTTAPVIASHATVFTEATSPTTTLAGYIEPTASDIVDTTDVVTCTPASGTAFVFGNTTVTCNATDAAGNHAIPKTFTVSVVDTTAPTVETHADIEVVTNNPGGKKVNFAPPAATDVVDGALGSSCFPGSGTIFAIGTTTVTCTATDAHGNASSSTFMVTANFNPLALPPPPFVMAGQQDESYLCLPDESDGWRACYSNTGVKTINLGSGAGLQGGVLNSVTVSLDPNFAGGVSTNPWGITINCYTNSTYTTKCPNWVQGNPHNAFQNYFVFEQAVNTNDNKHWTADFTTPGEANFDGSSPVVFNPAYYYQLVIDDNGIGWPAYGQNPTGNPSAQPYWVLLGTTE